MGIEVYPPVSITGGNIIQGSSFATSTGTLVLSGSNITISTGAGSIQFIGAAAGAATNFSLNGSSSSVSLVAGANIGFASGASSITISAANSGVVQSAIVVGTSGNTAGVTSSIVAGAVTFVGGNNITLSQSLQAITISGPTVPTATNFSLNGTSSSVSLVAGANITFNSGASSITIVGPTVPVATNFSLNGSSSSVSLVPAGIIALASNLSTITISASQSIQTHSLTALGNTTVSSLGSFNTLLNFSGAGIASVGVGAGTVTISVPAPAATNVVTSLNGSNGSLSISAGANIGIGQAASTITISASNQSALVTIGAVTAGGATSGVVNAVSSTAFGFVAGSNITLSQLATSPNITIIGPSPAGGAGFTLNGTSSSVSFVAGAGIAFASGASSITIASSGSVVNSIGPTGSLSSGAITVSGGNNITISSNGVGVISIGELISVAPVSLTQNVGLNQVGDVMASGAATASQTLFGSSLFLDRLYVPGVMNISEADLAMSFAFATTSVSGSVNRSFVVYSFSNSTKLVSLLSTTQGISFTGSNTTTGASTALSQVAAGWTQAGGVVVPMTFASSTLAPGDYVIGNIVGFSLASNASASLFGVGNNAALAVQTVAAVTGITSASLSALSNAGLLSVSAHTGTTNITLSSMALGAASGITAITQLVTGGTNNTWWGVQHASSNVSTSNVTATFNVVQPVFVSSIGTLAGSIVTGTTAATALSAAGYQTGSIITALNTIGAVTNVGLAALGTTSLNGVTTSLPSFNYLGASSLSSGASAYFMNGIFSTGGVPAAITIAGSNASLTTFGSLAAAQPWFAMVGA